MPVPTLQANASSDAASKDGKTEAMLAEISGFKGDLQIQANKITEAEERIGSAEHNLHSMHSVIKKLQEECAALKMSGSGRPGKQSVSQRLTHSPTRS